MRASLTAFGLLLTAWSASADNSPWGAFQTPSDHEPASIGSYTNGCLLGGQELPPEGSGYQVIRLPRHRNFGHPLLIDYLADLGARVEAAKLGVMLVGDVAMPRGGPFASGHRSHQTGLDADIWLRLDLPRLTRSERDNLDAVVMVDHKTLRIDEKRWSPAHAELIHLAATDPRVARIFVHPAIKKALCEQTWPDRSWLQRVRAWYRHDAHFHVRLRCPEGDTDCKPQDEPPPGDGCGAELNDWFETLRNPKPSPPRNKPQPPLPAVCQAMLEAPSAKIARTAK